VCLALAAVSLVPGCAFVTSVGVIQAVAYAPGPPSKSPSKAYTITSDPPGAWVLFKSKDDDSLDQSSAPTPYRVQRSDWKDIQVAVWWPGEPRTEFRDCSGDIHFVKPLTPPARRSQSPPAALP